MRWLNRPAGIRAEATTLTLNDELMYQAGFDVDRYEELARRRDRWRHLRGEIGSRAGHVAMEIGLRAPHSDAVEEGAEPLATHTEPGRATLNDRLMREAGFEVERYRALERRRALRRRRARAGAVRLLRFAAFLVLIAVVLKQFGAQRHLPGGAAAVVSVAAGLAIGLDWIMRGMGLLRFISRIWSEGEF
jgi:hypothetical protein